MNILPQIALITQRNTAKLYYFAEKDRLVIVVIVVFVVLSFWGLSASSARSAGDTWVSFVQYRLSTLACYSPADYADYADKECSKLHYSAEKDRLVWCGFCCFAVWGSSALSARSAGDTWVSFVQYRLSTLACYSPADYADKECSKLHYFADKDRLGFVWLLRVIVVLGFVCVICEICGRHWGFVCAIYLEYSYVNILPQITQITQRECSKLHYLADKDWL